MSENEAATRSSSALCRWFFCLKYAYSFMKKETRCMHRALLYTFNGLPLGEDGNSSLCHLLLVHNRRDLWAPAVGAHPDEMTCLVGLFSCMQQPPAKVKEQMLRLIRSASLPAPLWFCFFHKIHYSVVGQSWTEMTVLAHVSAVADLLFQSLKKCYVTTIWSYLMSSSLAKSMTTLALGFSLSRWITFSKTSGLGSLGIFTDWEMHTPPENTEFRKINVAIWRQKLQLLQK